MNHKDNVKENVIMKAIEQRLHGKPIKEIMAQFPEFKKELQEMFDTLEILEVGKAARPEKHVVENILKEIHPQETHGRKTFNRWVFTLSGAVAVILLFTLTYTQLQKNDTLHVAQTIEKELSENGASQDANTLSIEGTQEFATLERTAPAGAPAVSGQRQVQIFFSNVQEDPNLLQCNTVFPVTRMVKTSETEKQAITQLLSGLTDEEKKPGFKTQMKSGVKLQSLSIQGGVAQADFNEALDFQVGGSCAVTAIRAQIEETLKQFPTVDTVIISINGRTEDILQP